MARQRPRPHHHRRERIHPDVVATLRSPNQSARLGGGIQLIVLHSTESHNRPGGGDLRSVGRFFMSPRAQASAHVCTDGNGHSARFVSDARKAWHCGDFNSWSLGIEQIGHAADGLHHWKGRDAQLNETARWIALWSLRWGVPIRKGEVNGSHIVRSGVVEHAWLGYYGGGHTDPGHYPFQHVLRRARHYKAALRRT